jgi:hypothetical protein
MTINSNIHTYNIKNNTKTKQKMIKSFRASKKFDTQQNSLTNKHCNKYSPVLTSVQPITVKQQVSEFMLISEYILLCKI